MHAEKSIQLGSAPGPAGTSGRVTQVGMNAYVSAALTRTRQPTAVLAQKPQVFERVLRQSRQEPEVETDSCLNMPLLGRIWKEMAARLT